MIIKLIPETDEEKARYANKGIDEIEHSGVREYMLFGNKIDPEGDLADFHEWHGSFRYLMGSLNYFYETVNDNRHTELMGGAVSATPSASPLKIAAPVVPESNTPLIKRATMEEGLETLDLSKLDLGNEFHVVKDDDVEIDEKNDEERMECLNEK